MPWSLVAGRHDTSANGSGRVGYKLRAGEPAGP
jgi:hypothetical protein